MHLNAKKPPQESVGDKALPKKESNTLPIGPLLAQAFGELLTETVVKPPTLT